MASFCVNASEILIQLFKSEDLLTLLRHQHDGKQYNFLFHQKEHPISLEIFVLIDFNRSSNYWPAVTFWAFSREVVEKLLSANRLET